MASPQGALIKPSYCPQRNGLSIRDCSNSSHDGVGRVSRVILTPEGTYVCTRVEISINISNGSEERILQLPPRDLLPRLKLVVLLTKKFWEKLDRWIFSLFLRLNRGG
ncbi:hypothetical protein NPIL_608371 [Nephila pilipes]|uniref:Uncharacterized protein n=1 Tax=Nephila pilipes TaxID=299642 RepID=A0A8X6U6Y5_NEPPI|nr:hypothetical protein NPIL_608371 [Nephila pilipes]